tara:strand:- start:4413 stop:4610 length:198 start_codon:yes stop_codon:yes gene_type:complete
MIARTSNPQQPSFAGAVAVRARLYVALDARDTVALLLTHTGALHPHMFGVPSVKGGGGGYGSPAM